MQGVLVPLVLQLQAMTKSFRYHNFSLIKSNHTLILAVTIMTYYAMFLLIINLIVCRKLDCGFQVTNSAH